MQAERQKTLHEIYTNEIYWLDNYQKFLYKVKTEYRGILKPKTVGTGTGKRYYVKEENIKKLIKFYEESKKSKGKIK